ncbi:MAG: UMP kinase [Fibrobacterales bacterium]
MSEKKALKYNRILLKLSGEALAGEKGFGVDPKVVFEISKEIIRVKEMGVDVAIVIGGGNIVRGMAASEQGIERTAGDHMGMLATVINCIAMQDALEKEGAETRIMSAVEVKSVAEPFIRRRAVRHIEKGRIVLFAGGTGNPYFTTDSAATLRAIEIHADVIIKATKVDGIYNDDPAKNPDAKKYDVLNYTEVINQQLAVMDTSAVALCRENSMPILVLKMGDGNLEKLLLGEKLGTIVHD